MGNATSIQRASALVLAALMALFLGAAAALAQDYPPGPDETTVCTPDEPEPGDDVACQSGGWEPDSDVRVNVSGVLRTTETAGSDGFIDFSFETPDRDAVTITLRGTAADGERVTVRKKLEIQSEDEDDDDQGDDKGKGKDKDKDKDKDDDEQGGGSSLPFVLPALGAVVVGGGAVYALRRRGA